MNIITCDKCKSKFIFRIEGSYPGGKDKEDIKCPKCAHTVFTILTSGIVITELFKEK